MQLLQFLVPLEPLEAVGPYLPAVILVLVLANMVTRGLAHRSYRKQAEASEDDEKISRYTPHSVTNVLLVLASFAFLIDHPHGGMVMSVLALGVFVTDLFEFESRRVEARNNLDFERPKAALAASVLALLYAAFQSVFTFVEPLWNAVV
jgi:hypothetical protein